MNPDFVLDLVKEYMTFAPSTVTDENQTLLKQKNFKYNCFIKPIEEGHAPNPILKKCSTILEPLTKAVPGLIQGIYYLAKVKYISGNIFCEDWAVESIMIEGFFLGETDSAKINLQRILDKDPAYSDAHILMAQVVSRMLI